LKSARRLLNGSCANSAATSRLASAWNFGSSALVYPSLTRRRSTLRSAGPLSIRLQTSPAGGGAAALTKRDAGSMSVDQMAGPKVLSACRFCSETRTGRRGQGKRTDS
jgi:hypothetical protein